MYLINVKSNCDKHFVNRINYTINCEKITKHSSLKKTEKQFTGIFIVKSISHMTWSPHVHLFPVYTVLNRNLL